MTLPFSECKAIIETLPIEQLKRRYLDFFKYAEEVSPERLFQQFLVPYEPPFLLPTFSDKQVRQFALLLSSLLVNYDAKSLNLWANSYLTDIIDNLISGMIIVDFQTYNTSIKPLSLKWKKNGFVCCSVDGLTPKEFISICQDLFSGLICYTSSADYPFGLSPSDIFEEYPRSIYQNPGHVIEYRPNFFNKEEDDLKCMKYNESWVNLESWRQANWMMFTNALQDFIPFVIWCVVNHEKLREKRCIVEGKILYIPLHHVKSDILDRFLTGQIKIIFNQQQKIFYTQSTIFNHLRQSIFIRSEEHLKLFILVASGLFTSGFFKSFLMKDLYDPRIIQLIALF